MAKIKKITVVSKCQCNVCGQVAFVELGTSHHFCHGINLLPGQRLPAMFSGLVNPNRKGTWNLWTAPMVPELQSAIIEPTMPDSHPVTPAN